MLFDSVGDWYELCATCLLFILSVWGFFFFLHACVLPICEELAGYEKPPRGKGIGCPCQLSMRAKSRVKWQKMKIEEGKKSPGAVAKEQGLHRPRKSLSPSQLCQEGISKPEQERGERNHSCVELVWQSEGCEKEQARKPNGDSGG